MLTEQSGIHQWYRGVPLSARTHTVAGIAILVSSLGCFGVWAGLAPLNGAVVASGSFVATGQNKLVQHLEGGIIRELLVNEGDLVEPNQVLVRIDDTPAKAKLRRLVVRRFRLISTQARLQAELNGLDEIEVPRALAANADDAELRDIFERQRFELRARRNTLADQEKVLRNEIAGTKETIQGYEAQTKSTQERLALFTEELKDKNKLLESQLVRKAEVLTLQRAEASLVGDLGEIMGRIADAKERVSQATHQIAQIHSAAVQKAVEELRQTETELDDVQEQIGAAQDVVERTDVRAPVHGIVVKLNFHTFGGVAAPGAVILELLPVSDELVVKANLRPSDISHVRAGQQALVRLSALNRRITPMVAGKVIYVSADALPEQNPFARAVGNPQNREQDAIKEYYVVRVRLDAEDVRKRVENFQPTPGMPADVYISTGERTFFEYIMKPVLDSFSRAFRET
jgi:membrane fusion protein, type I secretion system